MTLKLIRTEADYQNALARIDELMAAKKGTAEGDELDVLATLVEKYEEARFRIEAPTPIAAIQFRMEQQDISARELEPYLGPRGRVSEILSGKRPLTIDMIRNLNRHLGIPVESLIAEEADPMEGERKPPQNVLDTLKQWGVLGPREDYKALRLRAWPDGQRFALLRKTQTDRTNSKTDPASLQAWCASALVRSEQLRLRTKFDRDALTVDWARHLAKMSLAQDGPSRVADILADVGIGFVVQPHFSGTFVDGAAMRRSDEVPIVALSIRHDRIDNFWFTLFHELAHVAAHLKDDVIAICDDLDIRSSAAIETEADDIAQRALIPEDLWVEAALGAYASTPQVLALAAKAEVNVAIVAGRWQRLNKNYKKFSSLIDRNGVKQHFRNALSS